MRNWDREVVAERHLAEVIEQRNILFVIFCQLLHDTAKEVVFRSKNSNGSFLLWVGDGERQISFVLPGKMWDICAFAQESHLPDISLRSGQKIVQTLTEVGSLWLRNSCEQSHIC